VEADGISVYVYFVKVLRTKPESSNDTHFQPFKVSEKQAFVFGVDPRLEGVKTSAASPNQGAEPKDLKGKLVQAFNFPRPPYQRELGTQDVRRYTSVSSGRVGTHLDALGIESSKWVCVKLIVRRVQLTQTDDFLHEYKGACLVRKQSQLCACKKRASTKMHCKLEMDRYIYVTSFGGGILRRWTCFSAQMLHAGSAHESLQLVRGSILFDSCR
jgi:hypothetical protein